MPRLLRDRSTWLIYAQLAVWGYFLYGFAPVVPLLRDEQHVTRTVASLHGLAMALGSMIGGGVLYPYLLRRFGRLRAGQIGLGGVAVFAATLCLSRPVPLTLASVFLASVFGIVVVSMIGPALTDLHATSAPAAISEANAAASGVGIIAPLIVGASVQLGWGWRPGLGVAVLFALVMSALSMRGGAAGPTLVAAHVRTKGKLPPAYWFAFTALAVLGAVEVCLSQWGSDVLRGHAGMSAGAAAASIGALIGGMFVGRIVGGKLALRYRPAGLLLGSIVVALAGFAVFWTATVAALAVAGLALAGVGMSVHYPMGLSLLLDSSGGQTDKGAGRSAYSMGLSFAFVSFALTPVADRFGPHRAFLLLPVLLAVGAGCVWRANRMISEVPEPATGR